MNADLVVAGLFVWVTFGLVAAFTRYFSTRPRAFIRTFVPREELRQAVQSVLRNELFEESMRRMSWLQFGVAALLGLGFMIAAAL